MSTRADAVRRPGLHKGPEGEPSAQPVLNGTLSSLDNSQDGQLHGPRGPRAPLTKARTDPVVMLRWPYLRQIMQRRRGTVKTSVRPGPDVQDSRTRSLA